MISLITKFKTGRFSSASEVVRAALGLFEQEGKQKIELIKELGKGENWGFLKNFDGKKFVKELHNKHLTNEQ